MKRLAKMSGVMLGLLGAAVLALAGAPSPARLQMNGFLAAFNTGDRAKIEAFGRDHMPPDFLRAAVLDDTMKMFESSGGLDVIKVEEANPHALKGQVRERKTSNVLQLTVQVDPEEPARITVIGFTGGPELVKETK